MQKITAKKNNISSSTIKICIIQLTRLGDIIQTIEAISNFDNHQNIEFSIIGNHIFTAPLKYKLDQYFKNVFEFDIVEITKSSTINNSLQNSLQNIKKKIKEINKCDFDLIINLSFTRTSAYLNTLLKAKSKTGLLVTRDNNIEIKDKLSQYFYTNVNSGIFNSFHLVDLFKKIIGLNNTKQENLQKYKTSKKDLINICIHPFSSQSKKTWPISKWSEVVYRILKNNSNIHIHLIGSKQQKEISAANKLLNSPLFENFKNRITSHVGKCNIEESEKIIQFSKIFIGHDSLNIHIAALNNIKTILIALGNSRIYETSPYSENSYVLSSRESCYPCHVSTACEHFTCHSSINYQIVAEVFDLLLAHGEINNKNIKNINLFNRTNLILHKTTFNSGILQLEAIINKSSNENFRKINNATWLYFLTEKELHLSLTSNIIKDVESKLLTKILANLDYIFELSQFGKKYSEFILREMSNDGNIKNIKHYSDRIDEIEELFDTLVPMYPELSGVINFFKFQRSNLAGDNLVEITEESYLSFESLEIFVKIMFELISNALQKPVLDAKSIDR